MANCKEQELEVTQLVEDKVQEAIEFLSNKSLKEAISLAERINTNQFFGKPLITVRSNQTSREDGIPEVSFNSELKGEVIQEKIDRDNEFELQERVAELQQGNNFEVYGYEISDDLPQKSDYNEYAYENVLSDKMLLKEKIDKHRDLLKNKKSSKENLEQLEELNELSRKLYIDISNLQKKETILDNYLNSVEKDIKNVKQLLKNPTFDNIQVVNEYLEILDNLTSTGPQSFLGSVTKEKEETGEVQTTYTSLESLQNKNLDAYEKLAVIHKEVSLLKNLADTKVTEAIRKTIEFHLKQKEEYKNWNQEQIQKEVDRLYTNQITKSVGQMKLGSKYFSRLDDQEEKNILAPVLFKVVSDALTKNNVQDLREKLFNIKDKTFRELKRLGKTTGTGFKKRADQSIFYSKSETSHKLIGKYSDTWSQFKKTQQNLQDKISKYLYRGDKTDSQIKEIQKQFDTLNEEATFIDVTRIPEITQSKEFNTYSTSFMEESEANKYKTELIKKIGNREYQKIIKEQKQKIYAYEVFKELKEARLRDKYNLKEEDILQEYIPEKEWNTHLHFLYSKSPFIFSENFRNKGNNIITKPYFVDGKKYLSENTPADLEYISYVPKKSKYFDSNFSEIESNPILNEAWTYMADLVEYNNANGFKQNPNNLTEYSLASQEKQLKSFPLRLMGLFSKRTLKSLHEGISTTQYRDLNKDKNIAGEIQTVDQQIDKLYELMIKKFIEPTESKKNEIKEKAKEIILSKQDDNIFDNILNTSEIVDMFKAKREVENKVKFIRNEIEKTDRNNLKEIVDLFMNKHLYQINNRANWNLINKTDKNLADFKETLWTKFYDKNSEELRKHAKDSLKELKKEYKKSSDTETKNKIQKEIIALEKFLESGGKVLTTGSVIEGTLIKVARYVAFSVNASAQVTNMIMGKQNGRELDGRQGFWKAGAYQDAISFSRKWKAVFSSKKDKKEIEVGELLLRRYKIFQNSANEIFKVKEARTTSAFKAVMENPINFVSEVEKTIQRPQIFALMTEVYIKDSEGNEVPMFDSNKREFPAFDVGPNGNLILKEKFNTKYNKETFIENTTQEYANIFGDAGKIPKAIAHINGDYRDLSTYLFEDYTLGALLMLFKRWSVETMRKNFGILNRLADNQHSDLGASALVIKGLTYGVAAGTFVGPIGFAAALGVYTIAMGRYAAKNRLSNDVNSAQEATKSLYNLKSLPITGLFKRNIYLSLAVGAQSLSMIIDPITKRPFVNSDHIKKLIRLKDKKSDGTEFTPDEIREVKEDIYFLTTSVATTLKFLALRYLVMMALYPDEEEEKEHKKRIKEGEKFWSRLTADPDTAMYYTLENMLSGLINDSNMLVNQDGLVRDGDYFGLKKLGVIQGSIEDWIKGEPVFKSGINEGKNKLWTNLLRYYMPAALKDGVSLGFGSKSKRDYNRDDFIDQIKRPTINKMNEARLNAYRKEKKELLESKTYKSLPEKIKKQRVNSVLSQKYPVIKDYHIGKDGDPLPAFKHLYKHYWD